MPDRFSSKHFGISFLAVRFSYSRYAPHTPEEGATISAAQNVSAMGWRVISFLDSISHLLSSCSLGCTPRLCRPAWPHTTHAARTSQTVREACG
jgi:hypothetical protein